MRWFRARRRALARAADEEGLRPERCSGSTAPACGFLPRCAVFFLDKGATWKLADATV